MAALMVLKPIDARNAAIIRDTSRIDTISVICYTI